MVDNSQQKTAVSSLLKKFSIQIPFTEDREEIENSTSVINYSLAVKATEESKDDEGSSISKRTYYLFINGILIDVAYSLLKNIEKQTEPITNIQPYLESEVVLSVMRAFEFSVAAAELKTSKQKKLSQQYYRVRNEIAAKQDTVRRNIKAGIKSGRPHGSKQSEQNIPKNQLYKKLADLIKSYYLEYGELPTQGLAAQALGFSYTKKLERLLDTYKESRSWKELANDLLRGN